jgi:hypothetical protein
MRRQTPRLKLERIDIDHDLAVLPTIRSRKCDARHRGKLLTEREVRLMGRRRREGASRGRDWQMSVSQSI